MSQINDARPNEAAKPEKNRSRTTGKPRKGRKAAKGKNARQKASQRRRKVAGRNFELSSKALEGLRAKGGRGVANPYRESSSYHACVEALRNLGTGRLHPFDKIVPGVVTEMGKAADAFKAKKNRSKETGTDWKDRIVQNVRVLARGDYGAKLRQVGYEIRTDRKEGAGLFKVSSK